MNKRHLSIKVAVTFFLMIFPMEASALLGFDFDITGSVSTGYDDNVTLVNENEKSDSVTKFSAGIGARQEGKTYGLDIEGTFTQHLFAAYSSFNNNSQNVNINLRKELSKYDRFTAVNRFVHAEDPGNFEDAFGRTSGRYSYYRNTFDTRYTRDVSRHVSIEGHYGNEAYRASRDSVNGSLLHSVGFDAVYVRDSATAFLAGYDFTARDIDGSGAAHVHTIAAGARHSLTKQLYLDGRAGVSFVESFDGSDAAEPSIAVALTNDFSETDSASLSYRKASMPSTDTADIWDSWRVALSFGRQLLQRLNAGISVFFGEGEYDALNINDTQTGLSTRFNYDVKEDVTAYLAYTYSAVDSNVDSRGYRRNVVEVGVRMTF